MKPAFNYICITCMFMSGLSLGQEILVGKSELGIEFRLDQDEWPVAFRCTHYGGPKAGDFWFSIRKKNGVPIGDENAWLIFEDLSGYAGELYRDGLNWKFTWLDRKTEKNFTINIAGGGEGYYYDWSLADSDGRMTAPRSATCE